MRILIASEQPTISNFLKGRVQEENGAVIVGQAENVTKTLMLARKLRPDVAIIDCYLPHTVGLDTVPLSRSGGLDAAQVISEEIPNTKVMVLNNLNDFKLPESWRNSDTVVSFARETLGDCVPLALHELSQETRNEPIFARVEVKKQARAKHKGHSKMDDVCLFGGVGVLSGLIMMFTLILMIPGIVVVSIGLLLVIFGFMAKVVLNRLLKEEN